MASIGNDAIVGLCEKKEITILVTDSGLGGMAILTNIVARLKTEPIFQKVSLIYYNAWPEQNRGYNRFKDIDERVRIFDRALMGMARFQPDIILIACNTLSTIYEDTSFSRRQSIPVIDIVRFGVDQVFERLSQNPSESALILGTVTTIDSDVHRSQLVEKGISPDRVVPQPCDQLATAIERGPGSDEVVTLVERFMDQAAVKLGAISSGVTAALFCTHFGYCRDLIKEELEKRIEKLVTIADPNQRMASLLFEGCDGQQYDRTEVEIKVVSKIVWNQEKIDAISEVIEKESPETAVALTKYEQIPDLFTF